MTLTYLHYRLANAVLIFMFIAGIWGLLSYFRRKGMEPHYWGILAVGEILILAQGLIGGVLLMGDARPERSVHILYGIVAVITLPAYFAATRGRDDRRVTLVYGLICLFLVAIGLRAMTTAM